MFDITWSSLVSILGLAVITVVTRSLFFISDRPWTLPAWAQTPAPVLRDVVLVGSNWDGTAEVFDPHTFKVLKRIDIVPDRAERLAAIAVEAAEQTGRLDVPEILAPVKLSKLLGGWDGRRLMFCDETGGAPAIPADWDPFAELGIAPASGVAGEPAAWDRWEHFAGDALSRYKEERNNPDRDGSSKLSPYLRFGVLHPRQLLAELRPDTNHDVYRSELGWREFYADVLHHQPSTTWKNLQPKMEPMLVDTDDRAKQRFAAWCAGQTGYPIVDAGMRQMLATGWMHNRVRMIVASFLVKDLHLPWQWGAKFFMKHLVDGDLASNSHGWQWTAGTGTDAAPYFRVFNPMLQGERYDPSGDYVRRFVPELESLPASLIHAPHDTKRKGAGVPIGYVAPIVDHHAERDEALARYKAMGVEGT